MGVNLARWLSGLLALHAYPHGHDDDDRPAAVLASGCCQAKHIKLTALAAYATQELLKRGVAEDVISEALAQFFGDSRNIMPDEGSSDNDQATAAPHMSSAFPGDLAEAAAGAGLGDQLLEEASRRLKTMEHVPIDAQRYVKLYKLCACMTQC